MKITKLIAVFMVLVLLLCGCSAASGGAIAPENNYTAGSDLGRVDTETTVEQTLLPSSQKLVRKIWMDAETDDMDILLGSVTDRIAQLGGYVEQRQIENGSAYSGKRYRYADLTVRIPADKLDEFINNVSSVSNITSTRETTEDVTLSYVENESQILALETEQARLLELLAQAKNMDDILKIENRLTNIRGQLEKAKSQLRVYDNLVSYGTVYLNITEVKEYTQVTQPETLGERMGAGLSESWEDMVRAMEDILVLLVMFLPYLLPLAVTGIVVLVILWLVRKKKAKKTPPPAKDGM